MSVKFLFFFTTLIWLEHYTTTTTQARHVRARTYTTLTAPPDMAVQKLHATTSDYNASASETDGAYPVGTLEVCV